MTPTLATTEKTKPTAPWNVKPGDRVKIYPWPNSDAGQIVTITRAVKTRATFTPCNLWLHYYRDTSGHELWVMSHGRHEHRIPGIPAYPAEKIEKIID
jgi:hypothetical protein